MNRNFTFELYFDGEFQACADEVALLQDADVHSRICFTDLQSIENPSVELGKSRDELQLELHARTPSGEWLTGVKLLDALYSVLGLAVFKVLARARYLKPMIKGVYEGASVRPRGGPKNVFWAGGLSGCRDIQLFSEPEPITEMPYGT